MADAVMYSVATGASVGSSGGPTQTVTEFMHAIVATSTSDSVVTVNPARIYMIQHNGLNVSNAAAVDPIALSTSFSDTTAATTTGSVAASTNKHLIIAGGPPVLVGPGVKSFAMKSLANAPTVSIYATQPQRQGW